jgi:hypothetical protein
MRCPSDILHFGLSKNKTDSKRGGGSLRPADVRALPGITMPSSKASKMKKIVTKTNWKFNPYNLMGKFFAKQS